MYFPALRHSASVALLGAATLWLGGCATTPVVPNVPITGNPVVDNNARLAVAAENDKALWEYRVAAAAIRRGQQDEAKAKLDDALARGNAAMASVDAGKKSRRMFGKESDKPFVGEPYEQIMGNFYRGVIYWSDGEPENARALFRTGEFIDSDAVNKTYAGDWVLLDYLDGYVSARTQGGDAGSDALARARADAKAQGRVSPPDYDIKANVMVFAEYGRGPVKYAAGENGEMLKFAVDQSEVVSARLEVDGRSVNLPPYDDVSFQATTRGGRVMDHILGNKATFKNTTDTVGNVALAGAVGTAALGRGKANTEVALGLAAVGLISKLTSAATQTQADTRTWNNLPQYLSFAALRLAPGDHPAVLRFYNASGNPLERYTQTFSISVPAPDSTISPTNRDIVVFRSELRD